MISLLLLITGVVTIALYLLGRLLTSLLTLPHDPREPPLIHPKIPFIGHIIGLLRHGTKYYSMMAKTTPHPIFTLPVPNGRMYIVTSPTLIASCDRRAKPISFAPYVVEFGRRILAGSPHAVALLSEDLLEERTNRGGGGNLRTQTMAAMHRAQVPGGELDGMVRVVLRAVDRDFAMLGLMVLPDILAPRGSRGRKRFFRAFREYYAAGGLETASYLIKARYEANKKYGVSDEDIARFDLGVCTALLVNTVPAVGWTLCHAFSDRALLAKLRQGIEAVVFPPGRPQIATSTRLLVDIKRIAEAVPLLESFVREVLRVESNSASARFVLQDTVLDDGAGNSYLVKKDSFLGMPSAPVHANEAVWGPTAHTFDPTRFLPERQKERKIPASAWRTFGGGNALCPGRHLALREIMSILVVMLLRCDVEPCEEKGRWKLPAKRHHISTSILTPVDDIRVRIRPRKEFKKVKWEFVWGLEAETR